MTTKDESQIDEYVFIKAKDTTTDVRIAVALEFIASQVGEINRGIDHLNTQMDSLIANVS